MKTAIPTTLFALSLSLFSLNAEGLAQSPKAVDGENYVSFAMNGSWAAFSQPRALYHEGKHKRTYAGWVDNYGDIVISSYDHDSQNISSKILHAKLALDDSVNPALLINQEGKLIVFFTARGSQQPLYIARATQAESIDAWEQIQQVQDLAEGNTSPEAKKSLCPVELKAEGGKLFLFTSAADAQVRLSSSVDAGSSWGASQVLLASSPSHTQAHVKAFSRGDDSIHLCISLTPQEGEKNSQLLYTCYKAGAFYKADGTLLKTLAQLPLQAEELDVIAEQNTTQTGIGAWDISDNAQGHPVIAYSSSPDQQNPLHHYTRWDGKQWQHSALPKSSAGEAVSTPCALGGMSLDHESPDTLYISVKRNNVFELEKWQSPDQGQSWSGEAITSGSCKDNIRPFAVQGAEESNPLQVLWMQNTLFTEPSYADSTAKIAWAQRFQSAIKLGIAHPLITDPFDPKQILQLMHQTTDWQFANPKNLHLVLDWSWGTFLDGVSTFYQLGKEDRYKQELYNIGDHAQWRTLNRIFDGNYLKVAKTWVELYGEDKNPDMIEKVCWVLDAHLASRSPHFARVKFGTEPFPSREEWWSVLDYLFMAPPTFAAMAQVTGEQQYLDYMDQMWWKTTDYLYDKEECLYYRDDRFFDAKSSNGAKVFWARGNGWAVGALVEILKYMPEDYPSRAKYIQLYHEMAQKLLSLQSEDGLWKVSLLDPDFNKQGDVSCATFYVYMFAWGLNHGLLDPKYRGQVDKAWAAICAHIAPSGRLGSAQGEGIGPDAKLILGEDDSYLYATGAFLLAASEMYHLVQQEQK